MGSHYRVCDLEYGVCDEVIFVIAKGDGGERNFVLTCNGDGTNDFFFISSYEENLALNYPCNKILIFNRWGQPVYEAEQYDNDWCGTYMNTGNPLPEGTYYFELDLFASNACDENTSNLGDGKVFFGSITVLR